MTELEKRAAEIASEANSCCHRSDGFEEHIHDVALYHLKKVADPAPPVVESPEEEHYNALRFAIGEVFVRAMRADTYWANGGDKYEAAMRAGRAVTEAFESQEIYEIIRARKPKL